MHIVKIVVPVPMSAVRLVSPRDVVAGLKEVIDWEDSRPVL